jgi:hypothetical protein
MRLFLFLLFITTFSKAHAQGCVAIRSNGSTCTMSDPFHTKQSGWVASLNGRYFKSFRHFSSTEEQKQRVAQNTEVINHATVIDLGITRTINNRWSLALFAPIVSNTRSSLYEHDRRNRYSTESFGLGDVRVAAYYWLFDPATAHKANIQLGFGLKLPTGDYRYQDYFHTSGTSTRLGPVDQSIQLGDGGTGLTLEVNAFRHLSPNVSLYANGYYLLNPREQNGVSTARGGVATDSSKLFTTDVMSVPDQYMVRAGVSYGMKSFTFSAGARVEGVPAQDLVGGNSGFRRPGYVVSVEPVVAYKLKRAQVYLSVPWAVERARTQSYPDKIRSSLTKTSYTGDAAFADYSINAGVAFRLD